MNFKILESKPINDEHWAVLKERMHQRHAHYPRERYRTTVIELEDGTMKSFPTHCEDKDIHSTIKLKLKHEL
jgi:hypothetical protein